jgi:hypothetical protein
MDRLQPGFDRQGGQRARIRFLDRFAPGLDPGRRDLPNQAGRIQHPCPGIDGRRRYRKEENRSLLFVEYINILTWRPNPANDSAAPYRLYLVEGTTPRLIASLSSGVLEFRERGVDKDKTYTYRLVAVDPETNRDGPPATVTVK